MRVLSYCVFCTYLFSYQCYYGCSCKRNNGNNDQKGELTQTHESVIRLKIDKNSKLYNEEGNEFNHDEDLSKITSPIDNILKNFNHQNRNIINLLKYVLHEDEKDSKTEEEKTEEEKEEEKNAKKAFYDLVVGFLGGLANEDMCKKFFKIFELENLPDEKIYKSIVEDVMGIVKDSSTSTLKEIFDYLLKLKLPSDFYLNLYKIEDDMVFLLSKSTYEFVSKVINSEFFNSIDKLEQIICNLISISEKMCKNDKGCGIKEDIAKMANFIFRSIAYMLCNFVKPIINRFAFPCNTKGHGEYYLIYLPKQVCEYFKNAMDKNDKFDKTDFKKENKDIYNIIYNDTYVFEINNNRKLDNLNETKMRDIYKEDKNKNDYGEFKFKYCKKNNNSSSTSNKFENERTVLSHDDIETISECLNMKPHALINEIKNIEIQNLKESIYNKFIDLMKNLYSNMVSNCNTAQMILNKKLKIELNLKPEEDLKPEENLKSEEED